MNYAELYTALVNRLRELSDLPAVQEENTQNIGRTGMTFVRATLLPSTPSAGTIGINGRDNHTGLFQIDVFTPEGTGALTGNALADRIIAHFPRGLCLGEEGSSAVIIRAYRDRGYRMDGFFCSPVIVLYRTQA